MRDCVPDKGYSMNRLHKTSAVAAIAAVTISLLTALISTHATAQQKFPAKPIRIIVAFTAGGTPDTLARVIGQKMSEHWGQPVIIENRPGASGAIAAHLVAKATPDGYTLLATSASIAINVAMQIKQPYDTLKDLSGVANIGYSTDALVVAPALGIKSLRDFIAHGRAHPGKLLFGSSGTGGGAHLAIDAATRESLEIVATTGGTRAGSLLGAIDRTVTGAGARLAAVGLVRAGALLVSRIDPALGERYARWYLAQAGRPIPPTGGALEALAIAFPMPEERIAIERHDRFFRSPTHEFRRHSIFQFRERPRELLAHQIPLRIGRVTFHFRSHGSRAFPNSSGLSS